MFITLLTHQILDYDFPTLKCDSNNFVQNCVLGIRNGDRLGHAFVHRSRCIFSYNHGYYYPVHLWSVVYVL